MTEGFKGRRLPDTMLGDTPRDARPGDYWKIMSRKDPAVPLTPGDLLHDPGAGNLTNTVWYVITPNDLGGMLSIHTVREEDDGTISIRPGDGSSNSVLIEFMVTDRPDLSKTWHGYIEHGYWREC